MEERIVAFGRDEMESLILAPAELFDGEDALRDYLAKLRERERGRGYCTLLYDSRSFPIDALVEEVRVLYKTLRMFSTVGVTQVIDISRRREYDDGALTNEEKNREAAALRRFETLARSGGTEALREEVRNAYALLEKRRRPQLWVEHFTRDLFSLLRRNGRLSLPLHEQEYLLDDIFYNAVSAQMLSDNILSLLFDAGGGELETATDSRLLFGRIAAYLELHLSEPLSMQEVCGAFNISQSQMARLFRRHCAQSYNKYLTELRVRRARELLRDNPGARIRDVAEMTGYADPLYFSRVFRSYVGKSPSDYANEALPSP